MSFANYNTVSAAAAGVDEASLQNLRGRIQYALEKGPLPSIQIALALHGRLVHVETFGAADNDTRYCVYSCTKPLVASAVWLLIGQGLLDISQPVASYLPEFAQQGKADVTVEQVLCHTGGFPNAKLVAPQWWTSDSRRACMAQWALEWQPDSRIVYHPLSGHWVLAELITELTGVDYRDYIQAEIVTPLGIRGLRLGVPESEQGDIAAVAHVGEPPSKEELEKLFGRAIDWPDMQDDWLLAFNDPAVRQLGVPGGGAVSTAADMALFYQALISNPGQLWDPSILQDAISTVRVDFPDPITGCPAHRGLGVVIAGSGKYLPYRGMGDKVSPMAFGHQGVGGQVAWGDPQTGLSFCLLTNGLDANPLRSARLCSAANNRAGACVVPG
jgi:CubicO group peptidase (beta-lactamase class C family)